MASSTIPDGQTTGAPIALSVSASRWSPCPCVDEDGVHEREALRVDDASCDPDVGRVGVRVLAGERVGQVRVDQEVVALELDEETALAEPPEAESGFDACRLDVGEERVVGEERLLHSPSSPRTMRTPSTRLCSFAFAAQRAVWLSPQSVENASRSGGAKPRKCRTRAAMSSGVST